MYLMTYVVVFYYWHICHRKHCAPLRDVMINITICQYTRSAAVAAIQYVPILYYMYLFWVSVLYSLANVIFHRRRAVWFFSLLSGCFIWMEPGDRSWFHFFFLHFWKLCSFWILNTSCPKFSLPVRAVPCFYRHILGIHVLFFTIRVNFNKL